MDCVTPVATTTTTDQNATDDAFWVIASGSPGGLSLGALAVSTMASSDKPPSQYIPAAIEKSGRGLFEAQCIPTDPAVLDVREYKAFLGERRRIVSERLNEFLQVTQA